MTRFLYNGAMLNNPPNDDPNRHLMELNAKMPLMMDDGSKAIRERLSTDNIKVWNSDLDVTMRSVRASGMKTERVDILEQEMRKHINQMRKERNHYEDRANALDRSGVSTSWLGSLASSVIIFVLDVVAFTFTFFALMDSIFSQQEIPPLDTTQMGVVAMIVAIAASVAMKFIAPGAVRNKAVLVVYGLAWAGFAVADISYLIRKGIGNVGVAMTALLLVMSVATYLHALHTSQKSPSRKTSLREYAGAYASYQTHLHKWIHALDRLQRHPQKGLADILQTQYWDMSSEPEAADPGVAPA